MNKFKFQRLTPSHPSHVSHMPENTGVENLAPSSHNFACSFKKKEREVTCENMRNTCESANPYRINNVRRGTGAKIHKIKFPMSDTDLSEFKKMAEAGAQFEFPEENPDIPSWSQIVPSNTDKPESLTSTPCYSCGSQTFWRKKDNQGGRWPKTRLNTHNEDRHK